jgi:drug/metabolite transporter (DMT)-like permease
VGIYGFIGVLVALHWWLFYASIKLSNASVGVTCIALVPVFTAFTEPLLTKRRIERLEVGLGVAVAPAVALVVGATPPGLRLGLWVGVLSAVVCSVFASLNKRYVGNTDAIAVTGIEMFAGLLFLAALSPLLPAGAPLFVLPNARDVGLLLTLSLLCTLLPFTLSVIVLRELSAFAAALVVNLEPVYAIAFSIVLFSEQRELGPGFYLGVLMLLLLVLAYPWLARTRNPVALEARAGATSPAGNTEPPHAL